MQLIAVTYCCFLADFFPYLSVHKGSGCIHSLSSKEWNANLRQLITDGPHRLTVKYHEVGKSKLILECMLWFQRWKCVISFNYVLLSKNRYINFEAYFQLFINTSVLKNSNRVVVIAVSLLKNLTVQKKIFWSFLGQSELKKTHKKQPTKQKNPTT